MIKFLFIIFSFFSLASAEELLLKDNLKHAKVGDFIVAEQGRTNTVLLVRSRKDPYLSFEEITVPSGKVRRWKEWIEQGAPHYTGWTLYTVNLQTGAMSDFYSYPRKAWVKIPEAENFLSTLLNLRLTPVPPRERKKAGPPPFESKPDRRPFWQPKLIFEGQTIEGVKFDAWQTRWPEDHSDLSCKWIEVYLPSENQLYPSYFPYWLQISGIVGKAKVRIIDSGRGVVSPQPDITQP